MRRNQLAYNQHRDYYKKNTMRKKRINPKNNRTKASKISFRFVTIALLITIFLLPNVCKFIYSPVINTYKNSHIEISNTLMNRVDGYLANESFLNTDYIGEISNSNLLEDLHLSSEMFYLKKRLKNLMLQYTNLNPGIFIWDYSNNRYVSINGYKEFPTASMIKLPILCELFRKVDSETIDINDIETLSTQYITGGSGTLQYRPLETDYSLNKLAKLMIQNSDNTATNMVLANIGGVNEFNKTLRNWGFSKTHMSEWLPDLRGTNVSTPADMAKFLYNIDNPDFLSLESRVEIVNIMGNVKNRYLIQAGLPKDAEFLHKTGDIGSMLGDAGIVILPDGRRYLIVLMVERPHNSYSAKEFIIKASKITYNSIKNFVY